MRPDLGARRDARRAADDRERMDDRVGLEHGVGVDPGRRRVDDRHAGEHVRLVDPVAELRPRPPRAPTRVFTPSVSIGISSLVHRDPLALRDEERDGVGQIELALRVVRRQTVEHRPQPLGPEDVDRGVDLADGELLRASRLRPRRSPRAPPLPLRTTRPYCRGSSGSNESTVAARAFAPVCLDEVAQEPRT